MSMRIAVFIKSTGLGGLETQNKTLCEGLAHRGHDITVFVPSREKTDANGVKNGVAYKYLDASYKVFAFFPFDKNNWFIKSVEAFKTEHELKKFDLIISQSTAGLGIIRHKKELGVKVVTIAHGTTISEFKTKMLNAPSFLSRIKLIKDLAYVLLNFFTVQREIILHSNKTVAVSNFVKNLLIEETYAPDDHIKVIYNGVDPTKFNETAPTDLNGRPINIISTSRLDRSKGLFILLDALHVLSNANWRLSFIGDGKDAQELQEYSVKKGLVSRVLFTGGVGHSEIPSYLSQSDIFVLPSMRIEGFPMTLVEAMLSRLPIIASNIGGIVDAVDDGYNGYLVTPGDISDLVEKLRKLIYDKDERERLGANGRSKAVKEFSLDSMLDKYELVFKELKS